jgi:hypothetical protein
MRLAIYSTIYPAAMPYLRAWADSVRAQDDDDFEVWVGLDLLEVGEVESYIGGDLVDHWVPAAPGDTPTQIRQRALEHLTPDCDAVVLVDSDDVLYPARVAAARAALIDYDLVGCAQHLIDERGQPLEKTLTLPPDVMPDDILPHSNVFGLSNSAYRTDMLSRCMPVPVETVALDWLLATRAWLGGARLLFDRTAQMAYRQHPGNIAQVLPPFTPSQIAAHTMIVQRHLQTISSVDQSVHPTRVAQIRKASRQVKQFVERVVHVPEQLRRYVEELNASPPGPRWWVTVAYPPLSAMWQ